MKKNLRLTMSYNVGYANPVFGVGILFVEEHSCRTICDETPIFHGAVRLARHVSPYTRGRLGNTYDGLWPVSEGPWMLKHVRKTYKFMNRKQISFW